MTRRFYYLAHAGLAVPFLFISVWCLGIGEPPQAASALLTGVILSFVLVTAKRWAFQAGFRRGQLSVIEAMHVAETPAEFQRLISHQPEPWESP